MKNIRISVLLLSIWLVFIIYTESLLARNFNLNIPQAGFIGLLVIAFVVTLVVPHFGQVTSRIVLSLPVVALLVLRALTGLFTSVPVMVITLIDVCALIIVILLTHRIRIALDAFEAAVLRMTFGRDDRLQASEEAGASYLYREVRRARNHQRPFALMSIAVDENASQPMVDRMVQEVQVAMMKQFTLASVSKVLCESLEDCAVIVRENDHFLVALPETKSEEVQVIVNRLRKQVSERAGVNLLVGTASLPKDGYTFEGLVSIATEAMKPDTAPLTDPSRVPVEKPLTR